MIRTHDRHVSVSKLVEALYRTHHISLAHSILELKSPEEIDSFVLNLSLGHLCWVSTSQLRPGDNNITH